MLLFLIRRVDKNIKYRELVDEIWRERGLVTTLNNVSQLAYRLRDKLKVIMAPFTIKISRKSNCKIMASKKIMVIIKERTLLQSEVVFFYC